MTFREGPFQDLRVPLTWTAAGATILAVLIAMALLLTDHRTAVSPGGYGAARSEFDELIEPAANVLSAPVRWTGEAVNYVRGYFFAVSENRKLRHEVAELQRWRDAAIALKNVNDRYEALLHLRTEPSIPTVSARVVLDARGPFANARLADAGSERGVRVGNPVMSEHGVAGRVVGVTRGASRFLMLTDVDSRTPVLVDRTNARAILTGDGSQYPRLDYLRGRAPVKEGDLILSSGDGGVFPRGLPVGVAARDFKGVWRARLYADRAPIDYVRVLVFEDFSQLVTPAALSAGSALPPLTTQERADLQTALTPPKPKPPPAPKPGAPVAKAVGTTAPAPTATSQNPAATARPSVSNVKPSTTTVGSKPLHSPKPKPTAAAVSAAVKPKPSSVKPQPAATKPAVEATSPPVADLASPTIPKSKPKPKAKPKRPVATRPKPEGAPPVTLKPKPPTSTQPPDVF